MADDITTVFGKVGCQKDGTPYNSLADRLRELDDMMPSGVSVDYKLTTLQWVPVSTEQDKQEFVSWLKGHQQSVVRRAETQQDARKFLDWVGTLEQALLKNKQEISNLPVLALSAA